MRIFMLKTVDFLKTLLALFVAACALFVFVCARASAFPFLQGERTYYLYSASSQAKIVKEYEFFDTFFVQGESVFMEVEREEVFLQELLEKLNAKILFTEQVEGTTSYYCYAKGLKEGVQINGRTVNLHIAVKSGTAVVGTPIIFGGY